MVTLTQAFHLVDRIGMAPRAELQSREGEAFAAIVMAFVLNGVGSFRERDEQALKAVVNNKKIVERVLRMARNIAASHSEELRVEWVANALVIGKANDAHRLGMILRMVLKTLKVQSYNIIRLKGGRISKLFADSVFDLSSMDELEPDWPSLISIASDDDLDIIDNLVKDEREARRLERI